MIRNVVVGRLHPGLDRDAIRPGLAAITALRPPGLLSCHVGVDLRLRETTWDFSITSDFVDEASYREYDLEAEHNRIRRELFDPICEHIARVQFQVGDVDAGG